MTEAEQTITALVKAAFLEGYEEGAASGSGSSDIRKRNWSARLAWRESASREDIERTVDLYRYDTANS